MRIRGIVSRMVPVAWRLRRIKRAARSLERTVVEVYEGHRAAGIDHKTAAFLVVFVLDNRGVGPAVCRLVDDIIAEHGAKALMESREA